MTNGGAVMKGARKDNSLKKTFLLHIVGAAMTHHFVLTDLDCVNRQSYVIECAALGLQKLIQLCFDL